MIATADSLTEWGLPGLDARAQVIEAIPSTDGSLRVKCEYDSDRIEGAGQPLYFVSDAHFFPTETDSKNAFRNALPAFRAGVARVTGRSVADAPELLKMGDESYAAYMRNGNKVIGNIFVVRRGRVLHSLVISKVYFGEKEDIRRLFEPMLEAAAKFENS